jgi:hypothetical protein
MLGRLQQKALNTESRKSYEEFRRAKGKGVKSQQGDTRR